MCMGWGFFLGEKYLQKGSFKGFFGSGFGLVFKKRFLRFRARGGGWGFETVGALKLPIGGCKGSGLGGFGFRAFRVGTGLWGFSKG